MQKRSIVFLCGVTFLLYSQINAQKDDLLTQAEFVHIIVRALGLQDQLPVAATLSDKIELLELLGYVPPGGWQLERALTKGDVAVVLVQILGFGVPVGTEQGYCIQVLADRGIMTHGDAEVPIARQDLRSSVNLAAAMPGARPTPYIPPYRLPVSTTR
jgi:hypothetical protein